MHIAASIALNDESSITQSLTRVGIELLGQLKITSEIICFHEKVVLGVQFLDGSKEESRLSLKKHISSRSRNQGKFSLWLQSTTIIRQ